MSAAERRAVAWLWVTAIVAIWVVKSCIGVIDTPRTVDPLTLEVRACQEDDPCWDCSTMGNRICGTTTPRTTTP